MTSKLRLYNFSIASVYETIFYNVCAGQTNCFYFCLHFYENFISSRILFEAIVYEHKNEVCCCCLMCRTEMHSETSSVTKQKNIFKNLENFWFSTIMFSTEMGVWQIFHWKFHRNKSSQQTFVGLEDVFKTCLEDVFNASSAWQLYVFQVVLKTSRKEVLKTSWKTKNYYAEDVWKTCLEDVLKTCLEDALKTCLEDLLKILWRQPKYLLEISVYLSWDNKSKCVSAKPAFHKSISDNSRANPKCINYWWLFGVMKLA